MNPKKFVLKGMEETDLPSINCLRARFFEYRSDNFRQPINFHYILLTVVNLTRHVNEVQGVQILLKGTFKSVSIRL